MGRQKHLIVLVGPTAVGKTDLSLKLAQDFQCPIVSADSRQLYKEMSIGTAKPSKEQLKEARHYFINSYSISEEYNAGKYEVDSILLLEKLFLETDMVILAGGSGLYVKAVCEGFDEFPKVNGEIRETLNKIFENEGLEPLLEELKFSDPQYYDIVDKNNAHRIIRALEVIRGTGEPVSAFRTNARRERSFKIIKIGINCDRKDLYKRIDERMEQMISAGLLDEVKGLYQYKNKQALQTVGYSEIFDFIDGKQSWEETIRLLKRNSRRYAKRQLTWFNKDKEITWFNTEAYSQVIGYIKKQFINLK
jgi:tRNA dimethylallyltransferase